MKESDLKNKLSPAQVSVMLHRVTEPPYFGSFWDHFEAGVYRCAACATPLFSSDDKFDSKTGWPSFKKPLSERDLQFKSESGPDDKVEIRCKKCKCHLGYVIAGDAPYYRINSVCLLFVSSTPANSAEIAAEGAPVKKEPVVFPSAAALEVAPPQDTPSNLRPLVLGVILGVLLGAVGTWYYLTRIQKPGTIPDTATTTAATTSAETTLPETPTTVEEEPQVPDVSNIEPVLSDTPPADSGATSTQ